MKRALLKLLAWREWFAPLLLTLACVGGWHEAPAQTMFLGDAQHRGAEGGAAPAQTPRVLWRFATGDRIVSSAVAHDGVLFFGSDDGNVYAVDAATGTQRWKHRTNGPVPSTPAVAGERVYFASYDSRIRAVDERTGQLVWSFTTAGERRFEARGLHGFLPRHQTVADPFDVYLSSPTVHEGTVYVGSGDGHVYALDAASGVLRWKFNTGEVVHASPAVATVNGMTLVVAGSWNGRLYALDAATGGERWHFQAGVDPLIFNQQGFQSSPAIVGDTVYVGCRDAHLYAIELSSGREKWRFATGASWVISTPLVKDGAVLFATSDTSLVHAVDAATGKPLWQHTEQAYMFGSPVAAGELMLIGVLNGGLAALDRKTGQPRWRWQTEAARENIGWVLAADGRFNSAWLYPSPWREKPLVGVERQFSVGSIFATPLVLDGTVFVGSADGYLYALR